MKGKKEKQINALDSGSRCQEAGVEQYGSLNSLKGKEIMNKGVFKRVGVLTELSFTEKH